MPTNGTCDRLPIKTTFSIEFPNTNPLPTQSGGNNFVVFGAQGLVRINAGILVKSLSGLKLGMVYESPSPFIAIDGPLMESWRVWNIQNMALGRDEQIFIPRDVIGDMSDPSFTRIRDSIMLDIVLQLERPIETNHSSAEGSAEEYYTEEEHDEGPQLAFEDSISSAGLAAEYRTMLSSLLHHVTSALRDPAATLLPQPEIPQAFTFATLPAIAPTGMGAAPITEVAEAPDPNSNPGTEPLTWSRIFFAGDACSSKLPDDAARKHEVIVMRRGGCTFSEKLANIPSFTPSVKSLKLVIVVSDEDEENEDFGREGSGHKLIRPLLDKAQVTPSGLLRHHQISMVMVGGGEEVEGLFRRARGVGLRRRYHIESQGLVVGNIVVV
jgi:hypothetical protein